MSVQFPFHHLPSYTLATLRANSPQSPRYAHSPPLSVSTLDLSSTLILRKAPDLLTCVLLSVFRSDWTRLLPRCFSCYPSILSGTCPIWEPNTQDSSWLFDGNMQTKCVRGEICDMCLTNQKWVAQKVAFVCKALLSVLIYRVS